MSVRIVDYNREEWDDESPLLWELWDCSGDGDIFMGLVCGSMLNKISGNLVARPANTELACIILNLGKNDTSHLVGA